MHSTAQHSTAQHSTARHNTRQFKLSLVCVSAVWCVQRKKHAKHTTYFFCTHTKWRPPPPLQCADAALGRHLTVQRWKQRVQRQRQRLQRLQREQCGCRACSRISRGCRGSGCSGCSASGVLSGQSGAELCRGHGLGLKVRDWVKSKRRRTAERRRIHCTN